MKTKGLTLKEAIESGRAFKRADEPFWLQFNHITDAFISWRTADVLANDFELKIEPREWEVWVSYDGLNISTSPHEDRKKIRVREILE